MSDVEMANGAESEEDDENLAYDPDQRPEERREVRKGYRALDEALNEKRKGGMDGVSFGYLRSHIQQSNAMLRHVKAPQEATLDSRIFLNTVQLAGDVARHNAAAARAFDTDDFVHKLAAFMGGRVPRARQADDDDDELVRAFLPLALADARRTRRTRTRAAPSRSRGTRSPAARSQGDGASPSPTLCAPPSASFPRLNRAGSARSRSRSRSASSRSAPRTRRSPSPSAARRRSARARGGDGADAVQLKEDDIQKSENETTKNVLAVRPRAAREADVLILPARAQIGKLLKRHKRINLFKFIVHPTDFAQSVENLFYLSFIIRCVPGSGLGWSRRRGLSLRGGGGTAGPCRRVAAGDWRACPGGWWRCGGCEPRREAERGGAGDGRGGAVVVSRRASCGCRWRAHSRRLAAGSDALVAAERAPRALFVHSPCP